MMDPPSPNLGGGMTDTALTMQTAGIAAHLCMHRREL